MTLDTRHLSRCMRSLESSLALLAGAPAGRMDYEVFRNAVVKGFEFPLDAAGKLLRKALKQFGGAKPTSTP